MKWLLTLSPSKHISFVDQQRKFCSIIARSGSMYIFTMSNFHLCSHNSIPTIYTEFYSVGLSVLQTWLPVFSESAAWVNYEPICVDFSVPCHLLFYTVKGLTFIPFWGYYIKEDFKYQRKKNWWSLNIQFTKTNFEWH